MRLFRSIKHAWQRVIRGYDDSIKWSFAAHLKMITPALKEFCQEKTRTDTDDQKEYVKMNSKRSTIYLKTLSLIESWEEAKNREPRDSTEDIVKAVTDEEERFLKLWSYVAPRIDWYWD